LEWLRISEKIVSGAKFPAWIKMDCIAVTFDKSCSRGEPTFRVHRVCETGLIAEARPGLLGRFSTRAIQLLVLLDAQQAACGIFITPGVRGKVRGKAAQVSANQDRPIAAMALSSCGNP